MKKVEVDVVYVRQCGIFNSFTFFWRGELSLVTEDFSLPLACLLAWSDFLSALKMLNFHKQLRYCTVLLRCSSRCVRKESESESVLILTDD